MIARIARVLRLDLRQLQLLRKPPHNQPGSIDDDQLAALVAIIAGINAWNRLNVITRQPGGDYQHGQWG